MKIFPLLFLLFCFLSATQFPLRAEKFVDDDGREIDIKLKDVDGNKYDLSKMRGNYVLVAFGATWCGPCHEELRDLEILHKEFKDRPVKFVWVSVDDKEQISDGELRRFAQTLDFTFPVLRDPDKRVYKKFSERTRLPLLVIFDKEGRVLSPNQFGAASQPGVFRINLRKRLQKLFLKDREALEAVKATDALEN